MFECDRSGERGRWEGVELGEEAGKGSGVGKETMDRGAEEDGGCVTAGGYVGGCPRCEGPRSSSQFYFFWGPPIIRLRGEWDNEVPGRDGLVFGLGFEEA